MLDNQRRIGYNGRMPKPLTNPSLIEKARAAGRTGEKVRAMRRLLGLSQVDMARRIGWPRNSISRIERGATPVSVRYLLAVELLIRVEELTEEVRLIRNENGSLRRALKECRLMLADEDLEDFA